MKLDERWRIYELMRQHAYISTHGYANKPYPKKIEKSQKKIISTVKKVLKKNIKIDDFDKLDSEIKDFISLDSSSKLVIIFFFKIFV